MTTTITITLHMQSAREHTLHVSPHMRMGELRILAREFADPGAEDESIFNGTKLTMLVVGTLICSLMDKTLAHYNIIDGTSVTVVKNRVSPTPDWALDKAEVILPEVLASIRQAELDMPPGEQLMLVELRAAQQMLQTWTYPLARGAANANMKVREVIQTSRHQAPENNVIALKMADRKTRELMVLLCQTSLINPKDRDGFLEQINMAYDMDLSILASGRELKAQLLLAYHKDSNNWEEGFISLGNAMTRGRRGGPRPTRRAAQGGPRPI